MDAPLADGPDGSTLSGEDGTGMKAGQLADGTRRLMYIEQKDGDIDGAAGRIGWVAFSRDGVVAHYRGRTLTRARGEGIRGTYHDEGSGREYWIARVKKTGSHAHFAPRVAVRIDPDARYEYRRIRAPVDQPNR
jgi:hypothetical protein